MLMFKLSRIGKKNQPAFRILVMDKRKDPWGAYLERVGSYNPVTKVTKLVEERIKYWLSKGAKPTPTLHNLFVKANIISAPKMKRHASAKPSPEAKK